MGLFDNIGSLLGGDSSAASLLGGSQAQGGMAGMLETLAANGLAEHVSSWMTSNPNLPVTPEQLHDALGSERVQQMASASGLPIGDFLNQLAQHLPAAAQAGADATAGADTSDGDQDSSSDSAQPDTSAGDDTDNG